MKTIFRILGLGVIALAASSGALAQQEPIIAVDITKIGVASGNGAVIEVAVTAGGSGYTAAPLVTVSGGDGVVPAELVANVNSSGAVTGLTIVNGGFGYTSNPTIAIASPGTQATATAVVSNGTVVGVAVLNPGSGYTAAPTISLTGAGGSGATATATLAAG